ncbi:hypothetical protein NL676_020601 [Syzygium grande]|nr:hypothetical protein NL676_020601 [Syzygium grande]
MRPSGTLHRKCITTQARKQKQELPNLSFAGLAGLSGRRMTRVGWILTAPPTIREMGKLGLLSGVARGKNERSHLSQRRSRPHCTLHFLLATKIVDYEVKALDSMPLICCWEIGGSTALFAQHALRRYRVGSGVSLVGICLAHVKASKVILSDGDLSTLSYIKLNLKMNQLSTDDDGPVSSEYTDSVKCLHLPWECASESELQGLKPDIILGADVIYDPLCPPHLVATVGSHDYSDRCNSLDVEAACDGAGKASPTKHRIAYISSVIRNANTFCHFLALVDKANLAIADLTGALQPASLLPYMQSYDRSSI